MVAPGPNVEAALQRLEQSETFARAGGLLKLLRFLLEHADLPDGAKETFIGTAFYGRSGTYDPRSDSIVRVSVKRLRARLIEYYEGEGKDDAERMIVPLGSYRATVVATEVASLEEQVEDETESESDFYSGDASVSVDGEIRPEPNGGQFQWAWLFPVSGPVLVACLVLGFLWLRRPAAPPVSIDRNLSPWPLTPGRDVETDATISPDGKTLAYVTRQPGNVHFQIFLRAFKANDQIGHALETGTGDALRPSWSPDGKTLAFLHCGIGPCDIETVPSAGGMPRSLRVLPRAVMRDDQPYYMTRQQRPIWTPDGKALIFPDQDPTTDREALAECSLDGGTETTLTTGKRSDEEGAAALSPDGRTVAFIRVNLDSAAIMTLDLKTHRQSVVSGYWDAHTNGMAWAPDGQGVLLSRQHGTRWQPWWVPLHGQAKQLAVDLPVVLNPVFVGDGKTLMATSVNRIQNIVVANEDGPVSAPQMLFRTQQRDQAAKFSPDGLRIAFLSDRSGRNEIWVSSGVQMTSQPTQLTHTLPASATMTFSWAPDGRSFLVGLHSSPGTFALVDAVSGSWSLLKVRGLEKSLLYCPIWSADGRWIYASASGERSGVFRIDPRGRVAPEFMVDALSYDLQVDGGRYLYFDSWVENGISRIALNGAAGMPKVEPVAELATVLASRKWVIADGGLYYLDFHDEERMLRRFDLQTRALTAVTGKLTNIAFAAPTLSVLPRRHIFLYSQWDENTGSQIVELRPVDARGEGARP